MTDTTNPQDKTLIELCDAWAEQGELKITWNGGCDSGVIDLELNDKPFNYGDYDAQRIIDIADNLLKYYSWAGEFDASGEAVYDKETKTFTGIDYYSEDKTASVECEIKIELPDNLVFDRLDLQTRSNNGSAYIDISSSFWLRHGMVDPRFEELEEAFNRDRSPLIEQIMDVLHSVPEEVEGCWNEWDIERNLFLPIGNKLVYCIQELNYNYRNTEPRNIVLDLNDYEEGEEDGQ